MSKSFFVTNRNLTKVLTINDCLKLFENLSIYNLDEGINLDLEISEFEYLTFGVDNISARGFELSYLKKENCYEFRILSPSSIYDWRVFLFSIYQLADFFEVDYVSDEEKEKYTINELFSYNFEDDILNGIKYLKKYLKENKRLVLPCLKKSINIDEELLDDVLSDDIVSSFSEFITKIENLDAYFAVQRFYNKDSKIIGVYTLTEGVRTVLPFIPEIEYSYKDVISLDDFIGFKLAIVVCNGDLDNPDSYEMIDVIDYENLFNKLDSNKYEKLDAYNYVISPLTKDELLALVKKK